MDYTNTSSLFELQAQAAKKCPHWATAQIVSYYQESNIPLWKLRAAHAVRMVLKVSAETAKALVNEMSAEHKNMFDKY
jgi:hypothetical protein